MPDPNADNLAKMGDQFRAVGTLSGKSDLTLDEALAHADRSGSRPADDRLAIKD